MSAPHVRALADALVGEGVRHAFGVVGSGASIALVDELAQRGVAFVPVAHEGAAAMMAGAACRDGRTRAVAIGIKGPGFANFLPGIASNAFEGRPALTISEAYAPGTSAAQAHKRLDHRALVEPLVVAYGRADASGDVARELIAAAQSDTPGPVHLDLCAAPLDDGVELFRARHVNESGELLDILEAIDASERPAIVLGSLVARACAGIDWSIAGVPVCTTAAAKGCIDEASGNAGGVVTGERGALSPEALVLARADLVITVGVRDGEMVRSAPFDCATVVVDVPEAVDMHEGLDAAHVVLTRDVAAAAAAIIAAVTLKRWGADLIAARHDGLARKLDGGWLPAGAYQAIATELPSATLVLDTGLFCVIGETVWPARRPDVFLGSSNGRFMGTGIPTAIGVAVAGADPVVAVAGDGGVRPYLPELRIAAERGLPLLVVLMSDGGYGTIRAGAAPGVDLAPAAISGPQWAEAVAAMGVPATRASSHDEFAAAIAAWHRRRGPLFVELPFDPDAYRAMVEDVR